MANAPYTLTEQDVQAGLRLLNAEEQDALSLLGIQAERLEIAQQRLSAGRAIPEWSMDDAIEKILTKQRSAADLLRYANKGVEFARTVLAKIEDQLRSALCSNRTVNPELSALGDNVNEVVKYVASSIVGLLLANLPGAIAVAVTGIATTLAVIVIKRGLKQFCAMEQ